MVEVSSFMKAGIGEEESEKQDSNLWRGVLDSTLETPWSGGKETWLGGAEGVGVRAGRSSGELG